MDFGTFCSTVTFFKKIVLLLSKANILNFFGEKLRDFCRGLRGVGLIAPQLSHHMLEIPPVNERVESLQQQASHCNFGLMVLIAVEKPKPESLGGTLDGAPNGDSVFLPRNFTAHVDNNSETRRGMTGFLDFTPKIELLPYSNYDQTTD